jgi:hypothetical protein
VCIFEETVLTACADRLGLPAHRTSQSTPQLPDAPDRLEWHNSGGQRNGIEASRAAGECRSHAVAIRAVSLPNSESELDHSWALLRQPGVLVHHVSRNARIGMAVSMCRTRPAQIMLCYRLLLPHAGLGCEHAHITEAFPLEAGTGHRPIDAALAGAPVDKHLQACLSYICACLVPAPRNVLERRGTFGTVHVLQDCV